MLLWHTHIPTLKNRHFPSPKIAAASQKPHSNEDFQREPPTHWMWWSVSQSAPSLILAVFCLLSLPCSQHIPLPSSFLSFTLAFSLLCHSLSQFNQHPVSYASPLLHNSLSLSVPFDVSYWARSRGREIGPFVSWPGRSVRVRAVRLIGFSQSSYENWLNLRLHTHWIYAAHWIPSCCFLIASATRTFVRMCHV